MHFLARFLQTIILLGALQGFILSSLLFFSGKKLLSDRLLAILLFLVSLASLKLYGVQQGWFDNIHLIYLIDLFIPLIIVMPIGPLIFFYIKASLDPGFQLTKKDRIHFYPVILDMVPQLTALIYFIGLITHLFSNRPAPWGSFIDNYNVYSDIPRWISVSAYVWMAARQVKAATLQHPARMKWLLQVLRLFQAFQLIWLVYLIPYCIPQYTDRVLNTLDWYPVYVPLAVLIYWLGIKGYIMSQREFPVKKEAGQTLMTPAEAEPVVAILKKAMETDKLYLNPTLTVSILAEHTGLAPKTLSAVLNQYMNKSFNEFVNEYRIREIKERLLQPESKDLTIAGLAYECGFNSQPTFQRAFKNLEGLSPREFLSKNAAAL